MTMITRLVGLIERPRHRRHASEHMGLCDRLLHNAHRLVLKGPSRRKEAKLED